VSLQPDRVLPEQDMTPHSLFELPDGEQCRARDPSHVSLSSALDAAAINGLASKLPD
jgi:hypothetical protein